MSNYLFANDKLYTLSLHAEEEMAADNLTNEDVIDVLENADALELSRSTGANIYRKQLGQRVIAVIVDDEHDVIVTAYVVAVPR